MYWSRRCASGCLLIDRKEADCGTISDEEIAYYKGLSMKQFELRKARALVKARRFLLLRKYVEFLRDASTEVRHQTEMGTLVYRKLLRQRPTSFPELQLTVELTQLLLDPRRYADFQIKVVKRLNLLESDGKMPSQHRLLGLGKNQLKRYWRRVNEQHQEESASDGSV